MSFMRKMMFTVHRSKLDFEETVEALRTSAQEHGWEIPMEHDLQENYQNAGYEEMTRVTTLYFCTPDGGYQILRDDDNTPMAVMMPMGVSVYETQEGEVFIAGMNLEQMSMMFGGAVKEVLREGAENYRQALDGLATPEPSEEIKVDGKSCLLGCAALTAVVALLIGVLIFILVKVMPEVMPKLMAKMMPKMMEMMEEADVQPPCARIILEKLETEE